MDQNDVKRIMNQLPLLGFLGMGVAYKNLKWTKSIYDLPIQLGQSRKELLENWTPCIAVCNWLQQIEKSNRICELSDSYGLKHLAAPDIGYVTNGQFILAAIHSGFTYRLAPGSPNVSFGMSNKSIKVIKKLRGLY